MSVSYIRIMKAEGDNDKRFESGKQALMPYMMKLKNFPPKIEGSEETDYFELYRRMVFANNYLLLRKLGINEEDASKEIDEEYSNIMDEPILTAPILEYIDEFSKDMPELAQEREADEEFQGVRLIDELNRIDENNSKPRPLRPDISKFLAETKKGSIKGVIKYLQEQLHPASAALWRLSPDDITSGERMEGMTSRRRKREPRDRVGVVDTGAEEARQKEIDEARERMLAAENYNEIFEDMDIDMGRRQITVKPSNRTRDGIIELARQISAKENISEVDGFKVLQQRMNEYMNKLTEAPFGTSGRAGRFGGEITERKTPNAVTTSMFEAAKKIGVASQKPNLPDMFFDYFKTEKDPYDPKVRQAIGERLEDMDTNGFHSSVLQAMQEGNNLYSNVLGREEETQFDPGALTGTAEEKQARIAETGAKLGEGTESSTMSDAKREADFARGGEGAKLRQDKNFTILEQMKRNGDISEFDYNMARMMNLTHMNYDPDGVLGGLSGNAFDSNHPLHQYNEEQLSKIFEKFPDEFIGMSRVFNKLLENMKKENEGDDKKLKQIEKLKFNAQDLQNVAEYTSGKRSIEEFPKDSQARMSKFFQLASGQTISHAVNQIMTQKERFDKLGMNSLDLINAAMMYAGDGMKKEGFSRAMSFLLGQTSSAKDYTMNRLIRELEKKAFRSAMDEEHHVDLHNQNTRWRKHHLASANMDENADEHDEDIIKETEECRGCHPDRFSNTTAQKAYIHSPYRRKKTPYTTKHMQVPNLMRYRDIETGEEPRIELMEGPSSLQKIAHHIFPDNPYYTFEYMNARQEKAYDGQYYMKWEKDQTKMLKRVIKNAVISGNPRAQNIYPKFNLYKTGENTISSGVAGMSNKELIASGFLFRDEDSYNAHTFNTMRNVRNAHRLEAMNGVIELINDLQNGVYKDEKNKPFKVSKTFFKNEDMRKKVVKVLMKEPLLTAQKQRDKVDANKEQLARLQTVKLNHDYEMREYKDLMRKTKPKKYTVTETIKGKEVERKVTEPAEITDKRAIEAIKQKGADIKNKYREPLKQYRKYTKNLHDAKNKLDAINRSRQDTRDRYNNYILGAFVKHGDELTKIALMKDEDEAFMAKQELFKEMYPYDNETILSVDNEGNPVNDRRYALKPFRTGEMGELGGAPIRYDENNKAIPRINNVNTMRAHKLLSGHAAMTIDEEDEMNDLFDDADFASIIQDNDETQQFFNTLGDRDMSDTINHSTLPHHEKEGETDEEGLNFLSEQEVRKRHQNSHFTKGAEDKINNGNISNLLSNWKNKAPSLCGTCLGHGHVSREEMFNYLRHHVPRLKGESDYSPKMMEFIKNNARPRDHPDWDSHAGATDDEHPMDYTDHEQLACPDCEVDEPAVKGGKVSNGLCSHCFAQGERNPTTNHLLEEGYIDQEGNNIKGKNHHYTHNTSASHKFDTLNEMIAQAMQTPENYLGTPLTSHEQYSNWLASGKGISREDVLALMNRKNFKPFKIDPDEEIPTLRDVRDVSPKPRDTTVKPFDFGFRTKTPQVAPQPKGASARSQKQKTPMMTPEMNVHKTAMDAHNKTVIQKRADFLLKQIQSIHQNDLRKLSELDEGEKAKFQPNMSKEEVQYFTSLYNKLLMTPNYHKNEKLFHDVLDEMQEAVEDVFSIYSPKGLPGIKDKMKSTLPFKDGEFNVSQADIYAGQKPFNPDYYDYYKQYKLMHGRFLTPDEIKAGVFEPGKRWIQLPEPTSDEMYDMYANNSKLASLLKKHNAMSKHNMEHAEKLQKILEGENMPLMKSRYEGVDVTAYNDIMKMFKGDTQKPFKSEMGLTWKKDIMNKIEEAGINKTSLNNTLNAPDIRNQPEGLGVELDKNLNKQLKPLFREYLKHVALKEFIEHHRNEISHPSLPTDLTVENFKEKMQSFGASAQALCYEEAAGLLGYDSEDEMDNDKYLLTKNHKLKSGEYSYKRFKENALRNATQPKGPSMPLGAYSYTTNDDGSVSKEFYAINAQQMLADTLNNKMTPEQENMYNDMKRWYMYNKYPNYQYEEDLNNILQGDNVSQQIANYDELRQAFASNSLPEETMKEIQKMQGMLASTHQTLQPHPFTDMMNYDYANEQVNQPMNMQPQQVPQDNSQ